MKLNCLLTEKRKWNGGCCASSVSLPVFYSVYSSPSFEIWSWGQHLFFDIGQGEKTRVFLLLLHKGPRDFATWDSYVKVNVVDLWLQLWLHPGVDYTVVQSSGGGQGLLERWLRGHTVVCSSLCFSPCSPKIWQWPVTSPVASGSWGKGFCRHKWMHLYEYFTRFWCPESC